MGNTILAKNFQKAEMPPPPPAQNTMMPLARLGFIPIALLWAPAIPLTYQIYCGFDLGSAFHLKLLGATALLGAISFLNIHLTTQANHGNPPNPKEMRIIPPKARKSLATALIGVAILPKARSF